MNGKRLKNWSRPMPSLTQEDVLLRGTANAAVELSCARYNELSEFERGYVACALWSSGEEFDDMGIADLNAQTFARMRKDCREFLKQCEPEWIADSSFIGKRSSESPIEARAGHDFWLTRSGHGAGFWDGDWQEPAASGLDKLARSFGEHELYTYQDRRGVTRIAG
jgi:hypothetical protein